MADMRDGHFCAGNLVEKLVCHSLPSSPRGWALDGADRYADYKQPDRGKGFTKPEFVDKYRAGQELPARGPWTPSEIAETGKQPIKRFGADDDARSVLDSLTGTTAKGNDKRLAAWADVLRSEGIDSPGMIEA